MIVLAVALLCTMVTATVDVAGLAKNIQDEIFLSTVKRREQGKGIPFPRIKGPTHGDKVCIVGAGPAGLHLAVELRRSNFTNLVILEKDRRVGGKSFDVDYRGLAQPQGTIFTTEEYFDNFIPLARRYGVGKRIKFVKPSIIDNYKSLELTEYLDRGPLGLLLAFADAIRYVDLHKELFGSYNGELMPRPGVAVLYRIRGTFAEFLEREDLLGLSPFFKLSQTVQGFGYLDEIAAFYGLMWNTPRLMAVHIVKNGRHRVFLLKEGFQKVWETIQEKENFKIKFNTKLESIQRYSDRVELHSNHGRETCGWLVWTPPVGTLLETLDTPTLREEKLLSGQTHVTFTVNLANVRNYKEGPYNVYNANLDRKTEHGVTSDGDWRALINPYSQSEEGIKHYRKENKRKERTLRSLQLSRRECSLAQCNQVLSQHYANLTGFIPEIVHTISWTPYFPRWSPYQVILCCNAIQPILYSILTGCSGGQAVGDILYARTVQDLVCWVLCVL